MATAASSYQCYYNTPTGVLETYDVWVPCYAPTSEQPYVPCCEVGQFCLENNVCAAQNVDNTTFWDEQLNLPAEEGSYVSPYQTAA